MEAEEEEVDPEAVAIEEAVAGLPEGKQAGMRATLLVRTA